MTPTNSHINYIELYANNLESIKIFYTKVFGWMFTDYGPTYTSFSNSGLTGGFEKTEKPITNDALVIIHNENLKDIKQKSLPLVVRSL
ncbi:VOC family protein [Psychroserpens burtonensis]|uniref:VOC family protein n=1 Tax=Psychroserpens burtonensis TaxID=49278 RepID=UPI001FE19929|nr:VOC family protein [Psychroserpens burtonensis]